MPMKRANYRAPREHRRALIVPRPADLPDVIRRNRRLLAGYDFRVLGRDIQTLRRSARRTFLAIPYHCTKRLDPYVREPDPAAPIVLTGHQPELYHPGVWLKNFLAGHLATAVDGVAVNLNVDNDEAHQVTMKAPVMEHGRVRVVEAAYLEPTGGLPYEELRASHLKHDPVSELRRQGVTPSLCDAAEDYWHGIGLPRVLGETYARIVTCARHRLERRYGLENLEALVSDVARSDEYRVFILDILSNVERFHACHNGGLAVFRAVHHEKNAAQPVPDLGREAGRWELPFWGWRAGQRRQRLWCDEAGSSLRLFMDGQERPFAEIGRWQLAAGGEEAATTLASIEDGGIRIRPRALTLTLFARVFVGDLFVHGLGGAIYDKVTEEIVRTYYGVEPPEAVMATGTMLLPVQTHDATQADRDALVRRLRDVRHNPERLLPPSVLSRPEVQSLVQEKQLLLSGHGATRQERSDRWHRLHEVNVELAGRLEGEPEATRRRLDVVTDQLAQNAVLRHREYSFVLHPRDELVEFYREATTVPREVVP
ncbi:MAG TPA: hypothetical protein PLP01_02740 [Phycisphaerae bacterium]|nr:hypothetical protein [Phycisphaerae bacterium]